MVSETNQPTGEPFEGINTSLTIFRPHVLHTHDQHVANYVRIMVESGMSLPMEEYQLVPLITEVLSLPSPYAIHIMSSILLLVLLVIAIYSLITASVFNQALQKIRLVNHAGSLAEQLHTDVMQQLELVLLDSSAVRLLDVLVMGTQHQTTSSHSTLVPLHPSATLSMSPHFLQF